MSGVLRYLRQALGFSKPQHPVPRTVFQNATSRDLTRFAEGDRALVDGTKLTFPLQRNAKFDLGKGQLLFNEVIGKPVTSSYVRSSKGSLHKVELPTLEEYVTLTPRLVTPVYASYASSIVSLLDINPEPCSDRSSSHDVSNSRIEVLEAGTGHGSLTLHLARAIGAANSPPPNAQLPKIRKVTDDKVSPDSIAQDDKEFESDALNQAWTEWKQTRRAVVHTVEAVPSYSIHAEKVVRGFRRGLYWPHIDFYTGDVRDWIIQHPRKEEFLDHVVLDMPGVQNQLKHVSPAMRNDAKLVVFVPSITQIADCLRAVAEEYLPLRMEKVLELGEGISNGRKWDVRFVRPRKAPSSTVSRNAKRDSGGVPVPASEDAEETVTADSSSGEIREEETSEDIVIPSAAQDEQQVMVCRPLVGERTFGGGFIALFKKTSPASAALAAEWRQTQTGRASRKRNR